MRRNVPHPTHDPRCPMQQTHQPLDCECGQAEHEFRATRELALDKLSYEAAHDGTADRADEFVDTRGEVSA